MFVNFKNVVDTFSPNLPFGIAQVGKAFRNEISPRDFLFRTREFEIMEFEYFIHPSQWEEKFEKWRKDMQSWFKRLGLPEAKIKEIEVPAEERAHYSKRTIDFLYDFPSLGFDEIGGLAYRTDFDLKNHQEHSGKDMSYRPKDGSEPFIPHVIEPTFGVDRNFLAVLCNAYSEDEVEGETRVFLKLPKEIAPIKAAVFPLLKNKPELAAKAREVYKTLKEQVRGEVIWDDNGNIGKRYRRQDEIGTPYCVTVDFDTLEDGTVTVRDRDTTQQTRQKISGLKFE
jgi:glycyl-tRNA synthetase